MAFRDRKSHRTIVHRLPLRLCLRGCACTPLRVCLTRVRKGGKLLLQPTTTEQFRLSAGNAVALPKATPRFLPWRGTPPSSTYGGKAVVDYLGRPAFAELVILWTLQAKGWEGAWITHAGGREIYRTGLMDVAPLRSLPSNLAERLADIRARRGTSKGTWDVCCVRDAEFLFAESKRHGRDSIKAEQVDWLEVALDSGLEPSSFLVVEWVLEEGPDLTSHTGQAAATMPQEWAETPKVSQPEAELVRTARPPVEGTGSVVYFPAGEAGGRGRFLEWREKHPGGFVINLRAPRDAMFHVARCRTLKEAWEDQYPSAGFSMLNAKIVAETLSELDHVACEQGWVRRDCGYCARRLSS
jgi:hypothetical protein